MEEKKNNRLNNGQFVKERFSFELRVNGNIICQRYFRINGFVEESLHSTELVSALRYCASLIQKDLKDKTHLYYLYTAPKVFKNEEAMNAWLANGHDGVEPFNYIVFEESEKVYFYDGETVTPYEKYFNRNEFVASSTAEQLPCELELSFLDNDRKVCSTIWDGNVYPRFIRTNIDLSNSKNRYKQEGQFAPMEAAMITLLNTNRKDLIPIIVKEFCIACSYNNDYKYRNKLKYGNRIYYLNPEEEWDKYVKRIQKAVQGKTNSYFKSL